MRRLSVKAACWSGVNGRHINLYGTALGLVPSEEVKYVLR